MPLHDTIRILGTIVIPAPDFFIPPSDSDPIHHFSTRDRRSANNLTASATRTTMNSVSSSQFPRTPLGMKSKTTNQNPGYELPCCCNCHLVDPSSPAVIASPSNPRHTSTPSKVHASSSGRSPNQSHLPEPSSRHRREPASLSVTPTKYKSLAALKRPPNKTIPVGNQRDIVKAMPVSELGELRLRKKPTSVATRPKPGSRIQATFNVGRSRGYGTRPERSPRPMPEANKTPVSLNKNMNAADSKRKWLKTPGNSFLSLPSRGVKSDGGRRFKRTDGSIISVNRFGWPLSRRSGTFPTTTETTAIIPETSTQKNLVLHQPTPRERASFEVDLSPIIEDVQSFPSLADIDSTFEALQMMNSGKPEQITATKHQDQDEDDPRNFEHVNLSGSFILQSTSCCDIKSQNEDIQPLPALVLTFPTPEPPTLSRFAASSGFQRDTINLTVPNLPRCSHCGFGFALDFHNLEVPQKHKPCRFCEPQWLACKTWYEGEKIMQSAESREHSAALKLTGDDRRALGPEVVDEHGQVHEKPTEIHAKAVGEGYSRFSNVIIKDKSASRAITVWRKVARLFASQARTERKESSERGRRRWWGRGTGTKENHD